MICSGCASLNLPPLFAHRVCPGETFPLPKSLGTDTQQVILGADVDSFAQRTPQQATDCSLSGAFSLQNRTLAVGPSGSWAHRRAQCRIGLSLCMSCYSGHGSIQQVMLWSLHFIQSFLIQRPIKVPCANTHSEQQWRYMRGRHRHFSKGRQYILLSRTLKLF